MKTWKRKGNWSILLSFFFLLSSVFLGLLSFSLSTWAATFTLESSSFVHNGNIPRQFSCDGNDKSPPLKWQGAPAGTKSFALIVDDPDAFNFVHWVLYNIPPTTTHYPEALTPGENLPLGGFQGVNDFGNLGYGGPCPPSGKHKYVFKLYALKNMLNLGSRKTKQEVLAAMQGQVLQEATLIGYYDSNQVDSDPPITPPGPPPIVITPVAAPPLIKSAPSHLNLTTNDKASLVIKVEGTPPFTYKLLNPSGKVVMEHSSSSQMTATFNYTNLQPSQSGDYKIQVSNAQGTVTSKSFTLTIKDPPPDPKITITKQPLDSSPLKGTKVVLEVQATGAGLSYAWMVHDKELNDGTLEGLTVKGAKSPQLTLENLDLKDSGSYSVKIKNIFNTTLVSRSAEVLVNAPVAVQAWPTGPLPLKEGYPLKLVVKATGYPLPTYKWFKNGLVIEGAKSSSYSIKKVNASHAGKYSVEVSNKVQNIAYKTMIPSAVEVTVEISPSSSIALTGGKIREGQPFSFSLDLKANVQVLKYQWFHNGNEIKNNQKTFTIAKTTQQSAGSYQAMVKTNEGTLTSHLAQLEVFFPPQILSPPKSLAVKEFSPANLKVEAKGNPAPTYQWYFNNSPLQGATSNQYHIPQVAMDKVGTYFVVVSNTVLGELKAITSPSVNITIESPPPPITIGRQPLGGQGQIGEPFNFQVEAQSTLPNLPLKYQWYFAGKPIPGANRNQYSLPAVHQEHVGSYYVKISSEGGSISSQNAYLSLSIKDEQNAQSEKNKDQHESAFQNLQNQEINLGDTTSFEMKSSFPSSSTFTWFKISPSGQRTVISGANTPTLTLSNAQWENRGIYEVQVEDQGKILFTSSAELKILPIERGVHDLITPEGERIRITVDSTSGFDEIPLPQVKD